jgi:nitroreductase
MLIKPATAAEAAMDALEAILTRVTVPQALMGGPGPDDAALAAILRAGAAAPDHGKLRPWRFLVFRGEGLARLGDLMADAHALRDPAVPQEELARTRERPARAPLIVAVVAAVDPAHPKIPEIEQIASAAAAAQNMLLAAHAQGLVGKWSTGKDAYDAHVKAGLGLAPQEHLLGFLYCGSPRVAPRPAEHADPASVTVEWR